MSRLPIVTGLVLACVLAFPAAAAKDDLLLVTRASDGDPATGGGSLPSVSADGRFVAFVSPSDDISGEDVDGIVDVYVRDLQTGTTTLVSRETGPAGAGGTSNSSQPSISADGRLVAFASDADNLSADDNNAFTNVFVRDVTAGTTTLLSRVAGAGAGGDASSAEPAISADGRFVAFESSADNLSAEDDDTVQDVYVRSLVDGTLALASRASGAAGAGADATSSRPVLSADGRLVAFDSSAENLSAEDGDSPTDVFVRDLVGDTTTLVSRAAGAGGAAGDGDSTDAAISPDGRLVAFASSADNLSAEDADGIDDIFVRDLVAATTALASRGADGVGDDTSDSPAIAASGAVAFSSRAENLSDDDLDAGVFDVFVRDPAAGTTTLVSRATGPAGAGGDASSAQPAIAADGSAVAFSSDADNLSAVDDDAAADVFLRDVADPAPPVPTPTAPTPQAPAPVVRCAGLRATIVGTPGNDVLRGTSRRDVIAARGGNDLVLGRGGNDVVCLGAGRDVARGGSGNDRILGGAGDDLLVGGVGRDVLLGGAGRDTLRGGAGADRLLGGAGRDVLTGGTGLDRLVGGPGRDRESS